MPVTETLGKTKSIGFNFLAFKYIYFESDVISAPILSKPERWKSIGLVPISQPPGCEILALPYLATRGPITKIEARIVLTNSYLASGNIIFEEFISMKPSSWKLIEEPIEFNNSSLVVISCRCGRFPICADPSSNIVDAKIGKPAFLAPEQSTSPYR